MNRKLLCPLSAGERLNLRSPEGSDWRLGARRKGHAREYIEDSSGWLWFVRCISWSAGIIFDVVRLATPSDGWDAAWWFEQQTDSTGCA